MHYINLDFHHSRYFTSNPAKNIISSLPDYTCRSINYFLFTIVIFAKYNSPYTVISAISQFCAQCDACNATTA